MYDSQNGKCCSNFQATFHLISSDGCNCSPLKFDRKTQSAVTQPPNKKLPGRSSTSLPIYSTTTTPFSLPPIHRPPSHTLSIEMADDIPEGSRGEVWMLDTFGNVHSLVNACKQLGFKVNRITDPAQLKTAKARPYTALINSRKCSSVASVISVIVCLPSETKKLYLP